LRPLRAILLGEFGGAGAHALGHDFARFEFHDRAGRDDDLLVGLFRIAADALFREAGLEHAEVAQFHAAPGCERFGDQRGQSRVFTLFKKSERFQRWQGHCESNMRGRFIM
jgi:hypothetical protein